MPNQYTKKKLPVKTAHPKNPLQNLPPQFALNAHDNLTTMVISYWLQLAKINRVSEAKIESAQKRLAEIEEYRRLHPYNCKTPD